MASNSGSWNRSVLRTRNLNITRSNNLNNYFPTRKRKSPESLSKSNKQGRFTQDVENFVDIDTQMEQLKLSKTRAAKRKLLAVQSRGKVARLVDQLLKSVHPTPKGSLSVLPPEIQDKILNVMDLKSLSTLCITSHWFMTQLCIYINGPSAVIRFTKGVVTCTGAMHYCCQACVSKREARKYFWASWGKLFKTTTCLSPTKMRMTQIQTFFERTGPSSLDMSLTHTAAGWGRFFMTVIDKWEFSECERVFNAIMNFRGSLLYKAILKFLKEPHASDKMGELALRSILRGLLLDHDFSDPRDIPFWLGILTHKLNVVQKAKLLFLLYAPLNSSGEIDYVCLCRNIPSSHAEAVRTLLPLATALRALAQATGIYAVKMFSVVEEITTFPEPWALDNFASLLLLAPEVGAICLNNRLSGGHEQEAITLFSAIKNLLGRWHHPCTGLQGLMFEAFKCFNDSKCKFSLFRNIVDKSMQQLNESFATAIANPPHVWRNEVMDEMRGLHLLMQSFNHNFQFM